MQEHSISITLFYSLLIFQIHKGTKVISCYVSVSAVGSPTTYIPNFATKLQKFCEFWNIWEQVYFKPCFLCPFLKKVDSVLYVYCLKFTLYLELVD